MMSFCSSPSTVILQSGNLLSLFWKMPNVCSPTKGSDSIQKPMLSQWLLASLGNNFCFSLWLQGAPRSLRRAHVVPVSWLIAIELPRWNPHNILFGRLRTLKRLHALHLKEFWIIYSKISKDSRRSLDPNTSRWIQKHKLENQLNSAGSSVLH